MSKFFCFYSFSHLICVIFHSVATENLSKKLEIMPKCFHKSTMSNHAAVTRLEGGTHIHLPGRCVQHNGPSFQRWSEKLQTFPGDNPNTSTILKWMNAVWRPLPQVWRYEIFLPNSNTISSRIAGDLNVVILYPHYIMYIMHLNPCPWGKRTHL